MVTPTPRKSKVPNILGDWDDVRFFLAVAKTGSFSAAATQLNTKQTTVGRRIQALERRLGAKLFDRHRHGMEVTPAARGVLVQAESMMSNATAIERHLAGLDREMAGVVRIAATEGVAAQWLVPRSASCRSHPDTSAGDRRDCARSGDPPGRPPSASSARLHQLVAARVGQFNMSIWRRPTISSSVAAAEARRPARTPSSTTRCCTACRPWPWSECREQSSVSCAPTLSYAAMEAVSVATASGAPDYVTKMTNLLAALIDLKIVRDIWLVGVTSRPTRVPASAP